MAGMNQIIHLLTLIIMTSLILPASSIMDAYGTTDSNDTSSSSSDDTSSSSSDDTSSSSSDDTSSSSSSSDDSADGSDSSASNGPTDDNSDSSTTFTENNPPLQSEPIINTQGENMVDSVLAVHNQERAAVGVPPLTWSDTLAAGAQTWAENVLASGNMGHSTCCGAFSDYGENIAWAGPPGSETPAMLAQGWADEKINFVPGTSGDSSTQHYTQMVWKASTEIGCGFASGPGGPGAQYGGSDVLVCQYTPPGNWNNQPPY